MIVMALAVMLNGSIPREKPNPSASEIVRHDRIGWEGISKGTRHQPPAHSDVVYVHRSGVGAIDLPHASRLVEWFCGFTVSISS